MSKYVIENTTLTAIGDAVRDKAGTTELIKVSELPTAIANIPSGGGGGDLPAEAFTITGDCGYRLAYNGWNWFIDMFGDKITTVDISSGSMMFYFNDTLKRIPFDINIKNNCKNLSNMFYYNQRLTEVPLIKGNLTPPTSDYSGTLNITSLFQHCHMIREIPENYFWNFGDETFWEACQQYGGSNNRSTLFSGCYSLRKCPDISMLKCKITSAYSHLYYNLFNNCYALDEVLNLPISEITTLTNNVFSNTFYNCSRLKNMLFETNEDGTPIVVNWKNQTIDLTTQVGYGPSSYITGYNSGITADKEASSEETYQAVKNDPDWFASTSLCSRYDHNSAVATINSLPDCSAYGTNTIKFKGQNGLWTDGGAIKTLTEEEIAVATAKGWTVTFA